MLLPVLLFAVYPRHIRMPYRYTLPADLTAFTERTQAALSSGEPVRDDPAAAPPEALKWRGRPGSWNLAVAPLPVRNGTSSAFLAVFSHFHGVQSEGDHIYRLIAQPAGWRYGQEIPETETCGYRVRDHRFNVRFNLPASGVSIEDTLTIERTGRRAAPCLLRLSCDMQVDRISYHDLPIPARTVPGLIVFLPPSDRRFTLFLNYHRIENAAGGDTISPTLVGLASYWYPHIARLPATQSVTVVVPKGWKAVGQGELLRSAETPEAASFTFRNQIATCYLYLVAGPYTITSRTVAGRKLSVYQLHPDPAKADEALNRLGSALTFFEARFGPFPYSHYEMVETPGSDSALEAYSFAMFSGGDFSPCVHELAHTWWGGILPNPYTTSLWSEVFAEYSQVLFYRLTATARPVGAVHGLHAAPDYGRSVQQRYSTPIAEAWNVFNFTHSAAAYGKGPIVMAMLEDLLGTDTMMRCLRRFRDDHVAGEVADWPEFEHAVNKETGKRYDWFFAQWLRRPGAPQIGLADVQQAREGDHFFITARIIQAGTPYRLRLPVTLELGNGQVVHRTVDVSGAVTLLRWKIQGPPRALRLDPEGTILMAGLPNRGVDDPFLYNFPKYDLPKSGVLHGMIIAGKAKPSCIVSHPPLRKSKHLNR